jgi:hypothetical protein
VAKQRLTLDMMPMRGGLATAGQRSTINETQLWKTENFYPDLDGMLRRRPGTKQHGQTLAQPSVNGWFEAFPDTNLWDITAAGSSTTAVKSGLLTISQDTANSVIVTRGVGDESAGGDYALKFTARMINPFGVEAGTTDGGQLLVIVSGDNGATGHRYIIDADTVSIDAPTDIDIYTPTLKLDLGGYHTYEFFYDNGADTLDFWFDGIQISDGQDMSTASNVTVVGSQTVTFQTTFGTSSWSVSFTDVMYDKTSFTGQRVMDVGQYIRKLVGGGSREYLLAATQSWLYIDESARGAWRPLLKVNAGHTFFLSYRENLIIFDDNGTNMSRLFQWDGYTTPTAIDTAPPVRFGDEHRTRLWAAGDRNYPLRAYYTASRQPDVWYAPAYDDDITFEEVTQAGYINIPSETGDEITGMWGEFMNNLIIRTKQGLWRVTGSGPKSFQVENITREVGGASPNGATQIGNDLFVVGDYGVISVGTAQQSGNLQTAMPSGPIADKWSSLVNIPDRVDRNQLGESYFSTLPSLNIAVLGMRGQGQDVLDKMFVWSAVTQQWIGPWSLEPTCFAKIEFGLPVVEILIHGHDDGRVSITGLGSVTDMGTNYTAKLASPIYDGRSLDPVLKANKKRWRRLKLYIEPRVNADFDIKWKADQLGWHEVTKSQNPRDRAALSNDFRLNIDRIYSVEDIAVVETVLDVRGQYFQFEFETDYDFALQGFQIELAGQGQEED